MEGVGYNPAKAISEPGGGVWAGNPYLIVDCAPPRMLHHVT